MASMTSMVDSSILIDYFRKTDKSKSKLVSHFKKYDRLYISSVTEFEVINGATQEHLKFWDEMLSKFTILEFGGREARIAADNVRELKPKRKSIDKPDLFIAATAIANGLLLDTLNIKHFKEIDNLELLKSL